jgi:hypothetical protein
MHLPFFKELPMRRGLGTSLRLVPATASMALLTRTASVGVPESWAFAAGFPLETVLIVLTGLSALYGALSWFTARDELSGRAFWILALASLSAAAAVQKQPEASLAWGLACTFSGGLSFLYSVRHRGLLIFPFLGLSGFSALPFTPAWNGIVTLATPYPLAVLFIVVHAALLLGYFRHAMRPADTLDAVQRWVWAIYPLGLVLLPGMHFLAGFLTVHTGFAAGWWGSAISLGLAALLGIAIRRGPRFQVRWITSLRRLFSLNWLYRLFWGVYRLIGQLVALTSQLLEGEGGLLWVLVLLALLASFLLGAQGE